MGRGRAKAKQTKVARQLKYSSGGTDLDALRAELLPPGEEPAVEEDDEDADADDPYAKYAADDEDAYAADTDGDTDADTEGDETYGDNGRGRAAR
ncbi:MAG: DUF3073 domain-containing protein [Acidothermales bacterium]|jgi:hypothetical protein|nr:DUF3073 domain-containing protein [Acidothermales bacterium]